MRQTDFSTQVEQWLHSKRPKTLGNLAEVFGKSSFATIFIICMALPALPLPTGGITHVLEVVVMLVSLQTIIGLKTLWLPKKFREKTLPASITQTALPKFVDILKRFEQFSRVRGRRFLNNTWTERFAGLAVFSFALGALVAIPFSGLDTVVSLGAVILSLGLVLDDIVYFIAGLIIGVFGIILEITVGKLVAKLVHNAWESVGMHARVAGLVIFALLVILLFFYHRRSKR